MEQNRTNQLLVKNRKIAETGIFLALFLGLAYAFSYIPNLEFASAIAFLAGLLLGWKRGLFVALIGEGIISQRVSSRVKRGNTQTLLKEQQSNGALEDSFMT